MHYITNSTEIVWNYCKNNERVAKHCLVSDKQEDAPESVPEILF